MEGNQLGVQFKHIPNFLGIQLGRFRINGAKRSEKFTVFSKDREGYIALESVLSRCVVVAEVRTFSYLFNDYRSRMLPDFVTDRRFQDQFIAGFQPEIDL